MKTTAAQSALYLLLSRYQRDAFINYEALRSPGGLVGSTMNSVALTVHWWTCVISWESIHVEKKSNLVTDERNLLTEIIVRIYPEFQTSTQFASQNHCALGFALRTRFAKHVMYTESNKRSLRSSADFDYRNAKTEIKLE